MIGLQEKFLQILQNAQNERPRRREWTGDGPAWIAFEGEVMLEAVNTERVAAGKQVITMEQLRRAEQDACGHVDYAAKFALYCAELATKG